MLSTALFLLFVAIAVFVQNLTGFALALVLLGLVGASEVVPLTDAVNAVTLLGLVNAVVYLRRRGAVRLDRLLWPTLASSLVGTVLGVLLLNGIAGGAYQLLRLLLGLSVLGCAALLWREARPLPSPSAPVSFLGVGLLSGLMGGLFSAAGPPLVYQLYRQPWPAERVREALVFLFGAGAALRLLLVVPTGGFTAHAALLAGTAIPVVVLVTWLGARRPVPLSPALLKSLVCTLLLVTGLTMVGGAWRALSDPAPAAPGDPSAYWAPRSAHPPTSTRACTDDDSPKRWA